MRLYILAVKYWLQGQCWNEALEYAKAIVNGWEQWKD